MKSVYAALVYNLGKGDVDKTVPLLDGILNLDYDASGNLVGIEIVEAKEVSVNGVKVE